MKRFAKAAAVGAGCAVAVLAFDAAARAGASPVARGRAIAQENCGRCHAIDAHGESANPKSPPFRYLSRRYPLANLEEALGEGIVVGHEGQDMPPFRLSTRQIEALLAYLASIQKR